MKRLISVYVLFAFAMSCTTRTKNETPETKSSDGSVPALSATSDDLPLTNLKLPVGFSVKVFAEVDNARSLAISPSGTVFVGNRNGDKVYAVKDENNDGRADKKWVIASGLDMPNGVAFRNGDLYVAEATRIIKFPAVESHLQDPREPIVIDDSFPKQDGHGWKYIAFGPDGKLYVSVGAPCNICEPDNEIFATIVRMNADGTGREVFAKGIRNTVGFTWDPSTREMWFTDNGRDAMGDDVPNCELNHAPKAGMHFGYPYCHEGAIGDPEFGKKHACEEFVGPVQKLGPHVAPLGLKFYDGSDFPADYTRQLFVARHGSWNRSKKIGYDVVLVRLSDNAAKGVEIFATGWLDESSQKAWGRPVDILMLKDGSMLVSDDYAGVIYRIEYNH